MSKQLPLALRLSQTPNLDDFVIGENQTLIDALKATLEGQGESLLYLFGPPGCGRTHLLTAQCGRAERHGLRCAYLPLSEHSELAPEMLAGLEDMDLLAIDDIQQIGGVATWETALFGLFNRCRDRGTRMLFSADCGPTALPIQLPDLRSRLAWGLTLAIKPLDDPGRMQLLQTLAKQRDMQLQDDVARYLIERAPRHPDDLITLIDRLDQAALAAKRQKLTIPFVRKFV